MGKQLLNQCQDCGAWTLSTKCHKCGGTARAAAPIKWSQKTITSNIAEDSKALKARVGHKNYQHYLI